MGREDLRHDGPHSEGGAQLPPCHEGENQGGATRSQLRSIKNLNRYDKEAINKLEKGARIWEKLRFITLTGVKDFTRMFRKLKYWLKTKMPELQYFGVRTGEGLGVVHFVFAGRSVRYGELSRKWEEISGSWNVSISAVKDLPGIIQEITRQKHKTRYFHSLYWCGKPSKQSKLILSAG